MALGTQSVSLMGLRRMSHHFITYPLTAASLSTVTQQLALLQQHFPMTLDSLCFVLRTKASKFHVLDIYLLNVMSDILKAELPCHGVTECMTCHIFTPLSLYLMLCFLLQADLSELLGLKNYMGVMYLITLAENVVPVSDERVKVTEEKFDGVEVLLYEPKQPAGDAELRRAVVYLHGGGWCLGSSSKSKSSSPSKMTFGVIRIHVTRSSNTLYLLFWGGKSPTFIDVPPQLFVNSLRKRNVRLMTP